MNTFSQLLRNRHLLLPAIRLAQKYHEADEDVWVSEPFEVEPGQLGSRYDFWHYLEGASSVRVESVERICAWLNGCEYVSDQDLFNEADYWQHPSTFEQLRRGDCEDFALWAWRKFGELGMVARFFIGRWHWDPDRPRFHAWVVFEDQKGTWLFEGASHDGSLKRPFEEAKQEYRPHFSVGHFDDVRAYGGWIEYRLWERINKRHADHKRVATSAGGCVYREERHGAPSRHP